MKKLTCEMCGSTDMLKEDGVFVCQNCGVKYSIEEAKKLMLEVSIEVDHTNDTENMLKRARDFKDSGDTKKAKEYYEKALDYDPENEEAKKFSSGRRQNYVIKPNITFKDCQKRIFIALGNIEKVSVDVFSEMKIQSVTNEFIAVDFLHKQISGVFYGTNCNIKRVSYIDYNNSSSTTNYREEIERTPLSGAFNLPVGVMNLISGIDLFVNTAKDNKTFYEYTCSHCGDHGRSDILPNECRLCGSEITEFTKKTLLPKDTQKTHSKLFTDFELNIREIILEKMGSFRTDMDLMTDELLDEGVYDGIKIDVPDANNKRLFERCDTEYAAEEKDIINKYAQANKSGGFEDYVEGVTYTINSSDSKRWNIYLPVCVIKYTYKGTPFIAIAVQHTAFNKVAMTCPLNEKFDNINDKAQEYQNKVDNISNSCTAAVVCMFLIPIFALIVCLFSFDFSLFWTITMPLEFCTCIWYIIAYYKREKAKKDFNVIFNNEVGSFNEKYKKTLDSILSEFLKKFSENGNIEEASKTVSSKISQEMMSVDFSVGYTGFFEPNMSVSDKVCEN